MLTKRIIPCLDIKNGRVVKGIHFNNLTDAGDPAELANLYYRQGADELVLLDISASYEKRNTMLNVVRKTANVIFIPFIVGGGLKSVEDIRTVLLNGADKVAINTAAINEPMLIREASKIFGSQCIVLSIDVKRVYVENEKEAPGKIVLKTPQGNCWWDAYIYGGKLAVGIDAIQWAEMAVELGVGEIMSSSLDFDGTREGYDNIFLREISERTNVPIIASSGAGTPEHILEVLTIGKADAALASSIFHYGIYTIKSIKEFLFKNGVQIRFS